MYPQNTSFFAEVPTLQKYWDSTSYGTFCECPFKYYLSQVLGYTGRHKKVDLVFGIAFHAAMEHFHRLRAEGESVDDATFITIRAAYFRQLLTEEERIRGEGYHEHQVPEGKPTKTPITLIRAILWYLDQFENTVAPNLPKTHILPSGKAAVELSFSFPIDEDFIYCGHFDRIVEYNDQLWDTDYKTTTSELNSRFFAQWTPDIQMTGYTLASQVVFEVPAKGVLVDAIRLGVTFAEFARMPVHRVPSQLEEFLEDFKIRMLQAALYAEKETWPQNPKACHYYGGCQFRNVCSQSSSVRKNFLEADFVKRTWDPRKER